MPDSAAETNRMREALKRRYPGAKFATKVNLMSAEQVAAFYARLAANAQLKR